MGGHQHPDVPAAYSDRVTYDDSGYHADGYRKVIIDPSTLQNSVETFKKQLQGQNASQLAQTLSDALGAADAFGRIPNAGHANAELTNFITSHANEMAKMQDGTLVEFIARVQAAAQLGYESDPATRAAAAQASHGRMRME